MSPLAILVLAVGMSVDAFAASLGQGASAPRARLGSAMRTGAIFGVVEAITPVIGWAAGIAASSYVEAVAHWIAFALLGLVGGRMLFEAARREPEAAPAARSLWMVIVTAIGTSIDAMAVGVSLAFLDVNIWVVAAAIGVATFCMATGGTLAGRYLGAWLGRVAEAVAGVALIILGITILCEHLAG